MAGSALPGSHLTPFAKVVNCLKGWYQICVAGEQDRNVELVTHGTHHHGHAIKTSMPFSRPSQMVFPS